MVTVGQKLWYVSNRYRGKPSEQEVVVTKIGRKWFELDGYYPRINIETLQADGGQYISPGRCYLSEKAYKEEVALSNAWTEFYRKFSGLTQLPGGMTLEKIKKLTELLETK